MTLPDERYRAVIQTKKFLEDLLTTPRIPKSVKGSARWCLRHYPTEFDMREAADKIPEIFATEMEPLYRMVKQHEQDKADDNNKNITG
jgi:hypothetical protein